MKKIPIKFEFKLPDRSELFKMTTKNVKETLDNEKQRLSEYLKSAENEINELIDFMTKGTNFIENNPLLDDDNSVDFGESKFSFIGEESQIKIKRINELYKEIKKGLQVYNIIENNKFFNSLNKKIVLEKGIKPDIESLNHVLKDSGFKITLNLENIISQQDFYDEDIFLMLKNIEGRHIFQVL